MRESVVPRGVRELLAAAAAGLLLLAVVGCAPEPGERAGTSSEQNAGDGEISWAESDPEGQGQKSTTIPESFPVESFALPDDAVVDDVGEREEGVWFIVLRAASAQEAAELWDAVIANNGFEVSEQEETSDGGVSASLENRTLIGAALTIPQEDGSVLLSYDLTEVAA